ncbi:MAG: hypothetical protein ACK5QX_03275, partial [bacterium]
MRRITWVQRCKLLDFCLAGAEVTRQIKNAAGCTYDTAGNDTTVNGSRYVGGFIVVAGTRNPPYDGRITILLSSSVNFSGPTILSQGSFANTGTGVLPINNALRATLLP